MEILANRVGYDASLSLIFREREEAGSLPLQSDFKLPKLKQTPYAQVLKKGVCIQLHDVYYSVILHAVCSVVAPSLHGRQYPADWICRWQKSTAYLVCALGTKLLFLPLKLYDIIGLII